MQIVLGGKKKWLGRTSVNQSSNLLPKAGLTSKLAKVAQVLVQGPAINVTVM